MAPRDDVEQLVQEILVLAHRLPASVPEGTKTDKLYLTITTVSGSDAWETFNRRFDILFGEDCRDADGHFVHLRRGQYGIDMVGGYLRNMLLCTEAKSLPYDLVQIKLDRLVKEMRLLVESVLLSTTIQPGNTSLGLKLKIPARPARPTLSTNSTLAAGEAGPKGNTVSTSGVSATSERTRLQGDIPAATVPPTAAPVQQKLPAKPVHKKQLPLDTVLNGLTRATLPEDDENDKTYRPPRKAPVRSEAGSPVRVFDSDGEEIVEDVTPPPSRKRARSSVLSTESSLSGDDDVFQSSKAPPPDHGKDVTQMGRGKKKRASRPKKKKNKLPAAVDVTSGEESDGRSALCKVETQEAAKTRKPGPANGTVKHWHGPVPIRDKKYGDRWEFKCRYCSAIRTVKRTLTGPNAVFEDEPRKPALANLASHLKEDHSTVLKGDSLPEDAKTSVDHGYTLGSAKLMAAYLEEGALNPALEPTQKGFYRVFAAWILDDSLPFTTGESPSLARVFKYLKVNFMLPSDTTVRNVLAQIFAELHGKVVHEFARVRSKIAYSTDTWSTRQMVFTFAGTLAHFIDDDWVLLERLVDFYHIQDDEHKGQQAAKAFVSSAAKRGGLDKIGPSTLLLILTMDNASANDVLARTLAQLLLKRYGVHFNCENARIRCIAHVVNLVVQQILSELSEADNPALTDYYELWNKHLPFHYDPDTDDENSQFNAEAAAAASENIINLDDAGGDSGNESGDNLDSDADFDMDELNEHPGQTAVKKLRVIVNKIVSSPQRRSQFHKIAAEVYTSSSEEDVRRRKLMVVRDVPTRWNYTHAMIERGLLLQEAIDMWVFKSKELRPLLPSAAEWQTLRQLGDILAVFTRVTKEMSHAGRPTLPFVLPVYEQMRKALQAHVDNEMLDPKLRNAVAAGLLKLQEYYSHAKSSHYTIVATALHPTLRVKWFRKLGEPLSTQADVIFKHVYEEYAASSPPPEPAMPVAATQTLGGGDDFLEEAITDGDGDDSALACTTASSDSNQLKSELDRYTSGEGGPGMLRDPLAWWKAHENEFPIIARMARDFLAIPATSVSVERLFSKSRHLCTDIRASLKASTITEAMCVKYWIRCGLLDIDPPSATRSARPVTATTVKPSNI